jgi:hypothetical protein
VEVDEVKEHTMEKNDTTGVIVQRHPLILEESMKRSKNELLFGTCHFFSIHPFFFV